MTTFADLGLRDELLGALAELGYEEPTPIQAQAIPPLLRGEDLIGQAATGTGKTAAFALPSLQRIALGGPRPGALVLVPTRELATQVAEAIRRYGRPLGARVLAIYGGAPIVAQMKSLKRGVDVVVATPGRAIDHLGRRTLDLSGLRVVVLDEADEMLDMGFAEDIETILAQTPADRQTVLFSATMPPRIRRIVGAHLDDPTTVSIAGDETRSDETPLIRQTAYIVNRGQRSAALGRILDVERPAQALVFCRTRADVDQLTETLNGRGFRAEALHGGLSQEQRTRVLGRLRTGSADLLVATDVAARGLDVDTLTHVVNYDVPSAPEAYVHRIGRVGRAGREGTAITLASPREHRMLKTIERLVGRSIEIESVPTVADLRARRLELTRIALRESMGGDDLESFRAVLDSLSEDFETQDVALAAIKLAHDATHGDRADVEIDHVEVPGPRASGHGPSPRPRRRGGSGGETTRIFIGMGRSAHVRPQDLVGAITGETRLHGRDIGAIQIADRFSLVEVPLDRTDEIVRALRGTKLKGRRPTVRREGSATG